MLYLSTSRFWWNVNSGHQRKPARNIFALRTPRFARVRYADSTLGGTCFACAKDGGDQQERHRTYPLQFHARCCSMSVAKLRVTQQIRHKNHLLSVTCVTCPTTFIAFFSLCGSGWGAAPFTSITRFQQHVQQPKFIIGCGS